MTDIVHRIGVRADVPAVYAALATAEGVAGWWTTRTSGVSRPGATLDLAFPAPDGRVLGTLQVDVVELVPDRRVHWRFRAGPQEWESTEATFDLHRAEDFTIVRFAHRNWRECSEFTAHCSTKWATFLLSLKDLVETGRGRPSPDDRWVGDWH